MYVNEVENATFRAKPLHIVASLLLSVGHLKWNYCSKPPCSPYCQHSSSHKPPLHNQIDLSLV